MTDEKGDSWNEVSIRAEVKVRDQGHIDRWRDSGFAKFWGSILILEGNSYMCTVHPEQDVIGEDGKYIAKLIVFISPENTEKLVRGMNFVLEPPISAQSDGVVL